VTLVANIDFDLYPTLKGTKSGDGVSIRATLYVTVVTCHHHFFKVEFAYFHIKMPLFPYNLEFGQKNRIFLATRSVLWPKHAENAIAAALRPGPRWRNSRRSPGPLVGRGGDTHPHTRPHLAPFASMLAAPRSSCPPWHQILATPPVTTSF